MNSGKDPAQDFINSLVSYINQMALTKTDLGADEREPRELRSFSELELEKKSLENQRIADANRLRISYGKRLIVLLFIQVGAADIIFVVYAWAGEHWRVPTSAMQVWLVATVVEAFSITVAVTRSLFPSKKASNSRGE